MSEGGGWLIIISVIKDDVGQLIFVPDREKFVAGYYFGL